MYFGYLYRFTILLFKYPFKKKYKINIFLICVLYKKNIKSKFVVHFREPKALPPPPLELSGKRKKILHNIFGLKETYFLPNIATNLPKNNDFAKSLKKTFFETVCKVVVFWQVCCNIWQKIWLRLF